MMRNRYHNPGLYAQIAADNRAVMLRRHNADYEREAARREAQDAGDDPAAHNRIWFAGYTAARLGRAYDNPEADADRRREYDAGYAQGNRERHGMVL